MLSTFYIALRALFAGIGIGYVIHRLVDFIK